MYVCIDLTLFRSIFCRNAYLSGFQVVSDLKVSGILRMYLFSPMVEFFNETFSNLSYLARRSNRGNWIGSNRNNYETNILCTFDVNE